MTNWNLWAIWSIKIRISSQFFDTFWFLFLQTGWLCRFKNSYRFLHFQRRIWPVFLLFFSWKSPFIFFCRSQFNIIGSTIRYSIIMNINICLFITHWSSFLIKMNLSFLQTRTMIFRFQRRWNTVTGFLTSYDWLNFRKLWFIMMSMMFLFRINFRFDNWSRFSSSFWNFLLSSDCILMTI